ncbi:MAG: NlpC/P60 family protein [Pseudomonadota bacterium]
MSAPAGVQSNLEARAQENARPWLRGRDPRLTLARADLAARWLEGQVDAAHFVDPEPMVITVPRAGLRPRPDPAARLDSELLFGERVHCVEATAAWLWVQNESDGYVGYIPAASATAAPADAPAIAEPSHQVAIRAALLLPEPDIKAEAIRLPWPATVAVVDTLPGRGTRGLFAELATGGFVPMAQLMPLAARQARDWVADAEALLGTPYLWGGRSGDGLDCSALVQLALAVSGHAVPRDSDMQAALADQPGVARLVSDAPLIRGDLVFWRGHVGIMQDATRLLHANAHHMAVASEPLAVARARIAAAFTAENASTGAAGTGEGEILSILRLNHVTIEGNSMD